MDRGSPASVRDLMPARKPIGDHRRILRRRRLRRSRFEPDFEASLAPGLRKNAADGGIKAQSGSTLLSSVEAWMVGSLALWRRTFEQTHHAVNAR
jgi:hypothetical protein